MELEDKVLEKFRSSLVNHRDELVQWINDKGTNKEVRLGGTSVNDVLKVVSELKDTLEKIDQGSFGICEVCHEDVDTSRLEMDYTASVCLEHMNEVQRRSLERDLELAGKVQRQLLACCFPAGSGGGWRLLRFLRLSKWFPGDCHSRRDGQGIIRQYADVQSAGIAANHRSGV
ncbi:MAG: hypothetical protein P8048_04210 [Calditrichia bacterium]